MRGQLNRRAGGDQGNRQLPLQRQLEPRPRPPRPSCRERDSPRAADVAAPEQSTQDPCPESSNVTFEISGQHSRMVPRQAHLEHLRRLRRQFPVLALVGPRQMRCSESRTCGAWPLILQEGRRGKGSGSIKSSPRSASSTRTATSGARTLDVVPLLQPPIDRPAGLDADRHRPGLLQHRPERVVRVEIAQTNRLSGRERRWSAGGR